MLGERGVAMGRDGRRPGSPVVLRLAHADAIGVRRRAGLLEPVGQEPAVTRGEDGRHIGPVRKEARAPDDVRAGFHAPCAPLRDPEPRRTLRAGSSQLRKTRRRWMRELRSHAAGRGGRLNRRQRLERPRRCIIGRRVACTMSVVAEMRDAWSLVCTAPGGIEPRSDETRVVRTPQGLQRLQQTRECPAVLRVLPEVLPIDGFGFRGPARLEQHGAERVTRRIVPFGRLRVDEPVIEPHGALEVGDGGR